MDRDFYYKIRSFVIREKVVDELFFLLKKRNEGKDVLCVRESIGTRSTIRLVLVCYLPH